MRNMIRSESPPVIEKEETPKASERKELNALETVSHIGSCQIQVLIKEPAPRRRDSEQMQEESKEESKHEEAEEVKEEVQEETKSNGIAIQVTENELLETTMDEDKTKEVHAEANLEKAIAIQTSERTLPKYSREKSRAKSRQR